MSTFRALKRPFWLSKVQERSIRRGRVSPQPESLLRPSLRDYCFRGSLECF
jgi:hypothetical protein